MDRRQETFRMLRRRITMAFISVKSTSNRIQQRLFREIMRTVRMGVRIENEGTH